MEIIKFLDREVEIIRCARRRGLTLCMHPDKIMCVKTNKQASEKQIFEFLLAKKNWIEKNINKFKKLEEQFAMPTLSAGACYPFLGELKYLQFSKTERRHLYFRIEDGFLVCYVPQDVSHKTLSESVFFDVLKIFYKTQAEVYLKNRLEQWSGITGLTPLKLTFRANQTRWGSCSSRKHISLNWKMICQPSILIDYVIVHELCHLRYLNHSADFWLLVESYLPSYKEAEHTLQQQTRLSRFLN